MDAEENADAGEGEEEREEDEGQCVAGFGCGEADEDREGPGGGEGGNAVQLGLDLGVLEAGDYGGEEVRQAVAYNVAAYWNGVRSWICRRGVNRGMGTHQGTVKLPDRLCNRRKRIVDRSMSIPVAVDLLPRQC